VYVFKNKTCPKSAMQLSGEVNVAKLIDPYSKDGDYLKVKESGLACAIYSIGPDGVDDQGSKVAATEDFFGKTMLATTPIFIHKIPYDYFFGNRKMLGDIVVSVNLSSISDISQAPPQ
jgi:hypothetical protein